MVIKSNQYPSSTENSTGFTQQTEPQIVQDKIQKKQDAHLLRNTEQDKARPDLNPSEGTSHYVPDMNEGADDLAATSAGTVGGAALGAALGVAGGPPGAVVGAAIGGVIGGIAGNDIVKKDHDSDDDYWHGRYQHTDYYREASRHHENLDYERDYRDAYRFGKDQAQQHDVGVTFEAVEHELETAWQDVKSQSKLNWQDIKYAVKDAWKRIRLQK